MGEEETEVEEEDLSEKEEVKVEEKKEEVVEEKKDNLKKQDSDFQKRINELVYKQKEAERREKAATEYAKSVQQKLKENETKLTKLDDGYINEFKNRVESQISTAKDKLKLGLLEFPNFTSPD